MKPRPPKILVIDNDDDILRILKMILSQNGYECVAATSAGAGLREFNPDIRLVITDLNMPGDGVRLIESIRAKSQVPVIVASAFHRQYSRRLRAIGNLTWLAKPIDFDELLSVVELELSQAA